MEMLVNSIDRHPSTREVWEEHYKEYALEVCGGREIEVMGGTCILKSSPATYSSAIPLKHKVCLNHTHRIEQKIRLIEETKALDISYKVPLILIT